MSFSNDVKRELSSIDISDRSLKLSELYALLLFGNEFSPEKIIHKTENKYTFLKMAELLEDLFVPVIEKVIPRDGSRYYIIKVIDQRDCSRIFDYYGHDMREVSLRINRAFVETDEEMKAFIRGAFLSCGSVSNPEKMYHLEFNIQKKNLSNDLCRIINEISFTDINIKLKERNGSYMAYLKNSDQITDFLTYMGASNAAMTIIGNKALKDIRNKVNRKANSEVYNLQKQAGAAAIQLRSIKKLKRQGRLKLLSEDLQRVADIRLENPDLSLREIGEMLDPPITRSGVNHRLEKLIRLANEED